ncbi:TPA: hypothetical protein DCR49_03195 [Candidatus Delongbacteria bacterium]|nr:MAG: hypothetical protein A2Y39_05935 [Candidatus Delongbacteria bacterium GWF2_40_14]HAQ60994.1 hypothetical protein [Candidatus Delongbacteria bacterium]
MKIGHVLKYAILVAFLVSCSKKEKQKVSVSFIEFSTDIKITVFDVPESETGNVTKILNDAEDIFRYFNSEMNVYEPNSTISRFNNNAMAKKQIPSSLRKIIGISRNIHKYTDKYFDIAIQPVVELWGFNTVSSPSKPDSSVLAEVLKTSNLDLYRFFADSVLVTDNRCKIGLGGIAKGYAADSTGEYLTSKGIKNFIVAVGGDILVKSKIPKTVGIRHPRIKDATIDTLYVADAAISTSGDYEKYIIDDGVRYCHIISPVTGYGISDIVSVSIISEKSYLSDAFATAVFVMGRENGRYFIEKNKLSGIIYYLSDEGNILSDRINIDRYLKKDHATGKDK